MGLKRYKHIIINSTSFRRNIHVKGISTFMIKINLTNKKPIEKLI